MPQYTTAAQIKMPKVDIQMNDAMSISNDAILAHAHAHAHAHACGWFCQTGKNFDPHTLLKNMLCATE